MGAFGRQQDAGANEKKVAARRTSSPGQGRWRSAAPAILPAMTSTASPSLRWARASLLGAVVLSVGLFAHVSADGLLPGAAGVLTLYAGVVCVCAVFLGREASTLRLMGLTIGGQGLVHAGLAAMAGHRGDRPSAPVVVAPTRPVMVWNPRSGETYDQWVRHLTPGQSSDFQVPGWATHAVLDMAAHPWMAVAHLLAAAAVGAWLAAGERALWFLLSLASNSVAAVVTRLCAQLGRAIPIDGALRAAPAPREAVSPRPTETTWTRAVTRRGPPEFVLAR